MSVGIDKPIDELITLFTSKLWASNVRAFYGRVFRNEVKDGFVVKIQPIYYSSEVNIQPIEVLRDDRKDAQCFFDVLPERNTLGGMEEANVRLMWMCNLSALYPTLSRTDATEQFKIDVINQIECSNFKIEKYVSGYTAFSDYQWTESSLSDLQSNHLCRFDMKIYYTNC